MADRVHQHDPTRPVRCESAGHEPYVDIASLMCSNGDGLMDPAELPGEARPLSMCELTYSMGNSRGNLREHWRAIQSPGRLLGCRFWDCVDQGIRRWTPRGQAGYAYGVIRCTRMKRGALEGGHR